jgi:hypothetical protein
MLLGNSKSDPRRFVRLMSIKDFQKESPAASGFTLSHGKELRPAFQPPGSLLVRRFGRHRPYPGIPALSRETSAAT